MASLILDHFKFAASSGAVTVPTINKDNEILFKEYKNELQKLKEVDEECISVKKRVHFMKEHQNEVNLASVAITAMLKASCENCTAENHLIEVAERAIKSVQKNICQMENLSKHMKEKVFKIENNIFARRVKVRNLQEYLHIESNNLDGWMNYAEQKCDDIYAIKCFYHKDDSLLKVKVNLNKSREQNLFAKINKLSLEKAKLKRRLDKALIDGSVQKLQMEKLGREARNDVEERIDVLKLWEKTVIRTQNRGREIDALLQSVEALSHRIDAKSQERNERECGLKHAVKDTSEQNTRLEKFVKQLEFLKQKHSSLHVEIKDACSQLKVLRVITERSHISTNSLRSNIKEKRTIISLLTEKLTTTLEQIGELKGKAEEICTSKVSIDQLVIEAEHHLQEEEKNAIKFRKEIKNLCRSRFNILQERKIANEERLRIENLVRNCRNELEKLNNQIHIEEEKVMHQERTIYEQDFKIVQIENRLSKLQNETLSDETKDYQEGIQRLSTELERLSKVQRKLLTELEILQVESKQVERAFEELLSEKGTVDLIKENDTIYVEQAETSLKRCKNEYKTVLVDKTMLKLKMRRSNEKLQFYNEKVFDLEKDRLYMKNCEKERETDISIAIGMAVATLRLTNEENAKLKKEINCRRLQTSKLINRYEIESLKMARTSEGRVGNQPLHMIKVLQEMDGLKSHGDKLDAEIKQSEKELEALQNTLSLLKESNRICESSYLEAESDLVQERNILEQSRKELKSTVHRKKEQLLSTRTKVEELKLAMDAADQELIKAQFCGNELQTDTSKLEKAINILDQRILRATRCLTKSKSAALKHIRKVGDIKEMEIRADIELQLKRELNEKLVALTMSQLRSKDQKGVEVQARVYLAAADIITGPRSSWAPLRDTTRLSGTSSTGNPCSSAAATTPSPTSTRSSIPQQLSLPEGRTLLGESSSCRASTKSERPSKDSCG